MVLYTPTENEVYMSKEQINYFRKRLIEWRDELVAGSREIFSALKEGDFRKPDLIDLGSMQAEKERLLKTRNQQNQMISRIEHALCRIKDGTYGYCEATGEEIGLNRLLVMPLATLSVDAQERLERKGRTYH